MKPWEVIRLASLQFILRTSNTLMVPQILLCMLQLTDRCTNNLPLPNCRSPIPLHILVCCNELTQFIFKDEFDISPRTYPAYTVVESGAMYSPGTGQYYTSGSNNTITYSQVRTASM